MNLAAAATEQQVAIIRSQTPDVLSHTGRSCCAKARVWLAAMGRSFDFSVTDNCKLTGPGWLRHRYTWGPSRWPIYWCEAVRLETIDCGLFRAFALEIFQAKGLNAWSAQVLKQQQSQATKHWRGLWSKLESSFPWAAENFVYHEVVAVRVDANHCKIYDPTDGVWIDPSRSSGHNGHFAVRIETPEMLSWQGVAVGGFQWTEL